MSVDIETEAQRLLQKLIAAIPKDEKGNYHSGFLKSHKEKTEHWCWEDPFLGSSSMAEVISRIRNDVDQLYFKAFAGQIREGDRATYDGWAYNYDNGNHWDIVLGRELPERFDYLKPIDCYEQLLDCLSEIQQACSPLTLDGETSPSFKQCVCILWAIVDSCDWNDEHLRFLPWFKKLRDICLRAASAQFDTDLGLTAPVQAPEREAEEEKPAPAPQVEVEAPVPSPQVEKKPRKEKVARKSWPERSLFIFQQMDLILNNPKVDGKYVWNDSEGRHKVSNKTDVARQVIKLANKRFGRPNRRDLQEASSAVHEWRDWVKAGRPRQ